MGSLLPEYAFFEDYEEDVLSTRSTIERLTLLDDEIANKVLISRYQGPVDSFEWRYLEQYYSGLFGDFVVERIEGFVDTAPVEEHHDRFHEFRRSIALLNRDLPTSAAAATITLPRPAERLLLKRLRQLGYDPSSIDLSYIERGGALYLLELFVTAAQQEASGDTPLLSALLDETSRLSEREKEEVLDALRHPVLMLTLWKNQREGLQAWLDDDREGILEMATATGKTVAGIAAIAHICGDIPERPDQSPETDDASIMVVAHSNAILSQWEREIGDRLGLPVSELSGSGRPDTLRFGTGKIDFYTAQSLLPQYDRDLESEYDLVIYDEVHHYSNVDGFGAAIQRPNYRAALGLSATIGEGTDPKRHRLEEILGDVVYTYDVKDAQRDGIIPDFEWTVHPTALDPYERDEWEKTTKSISDQFKYLKHSDETKRILRQLSVPFVELEDLGDFIQAHQAAEMELDRDLPDSWGRLQASIQSRNWIRHRSQPKLDDAIDLAKKYLTEVDHGAKVVMFAMDIETTEKIAEKLRKVSDNVFLAHSKLASSTKKKDQIVRQQIDGFARADHGVLVAPKLLDEGIDVPDAEVGINVAGTKTKLQLVQRMGRVLRKHGDQRPHFHHYVAVPDDQFLDGLDSKEYVQDLNWVRELGEQIGQQPVIESADVDQDILERAERRGHELWARDLLADLGVETVQGTLHLDELIEDLTLDAARTLYETVDLWGDEVVKSDWKSTMAILRSDSELTPGTLQRVWWLFPLYRERPSELEELLSGVIDTMADMEAEDSSSHDAFGSVDEEDTRSGDGSDHAEQGPESADVKSADGGFVSDLSEPVDGEQRECNKHSSSTESEGTAPETETSVSSSEVTSDSAERQRDREEPNRGVLSRLRALFGK